MVSMGLLAILHGLDAEPTVGHTKPGTQEALSEKSIQDYLVRKPNSGLSVFVLLPLCHHISFVIQLRPNHTFTDTFCRYLEIRCG